MEAVASAMMYRHALWPPSPAWPQGYLYGARVEDFEAHFPRKVRELGAPARVWDSLPFADPADD